jgi:hypothetical protein
MSRFVSTTALTPALREHQRFVYDEYLELPASL